MSEEKKIEETVSMAKKFILRENKVSEADIDAIRTNAEADELINYLTKKNEKPDEKEDPKVIKFRGNVGNPPSALPPPDHLNEQYTQDLRQALDPLTPVKGTNNRWNASARLLVRFDEDNPSGRLY